MVSLWIPGHDVEVAKADFFLGVGGCPFSVVVWLLVVATCGGPVRSRFFLVGRATWTK